MIIEGIVTTTDRDGRVNVAPMGPIFSGPDASSFLLRPFKSSTTYANLKSVPEGVFHITDDVELFARTVLNQGDFSTRAAELVRGRVLENCCRYLEFRVVELDDRQERCSIEARVVKRERLRDFIGFNRARHAVIEAAILASRMGILPLEEIRSEMAGLEILVEKTGGEGERSAFEFLRSHVDHAAREASEEASLRVRTGSRLHLGLFSPGNAMPPYRSHGGLGFMVESPGIDLVLRQANSLKSSGPLAERALTTLTAVFQRLDRSARSSTTGAEVLIREASPEHVGLGTGTQLAMALARGVLGLLGKDGTPMRELAALAGRGKRSAIGIHGFEQGGFLVDGGHRDRDDDSLAPLLTRMELPSDWAVVLVFPRQKRGLSGKRERDAFFELLGERDHSRTSAEISRNVLLALLPALSDGDFQCFSRAVGELQQKVGELFEDLQGGIYASALGQEIIGYLEKAGFDGVGQSSWGPTLFALIEDRDRASHLASDLRQRFNLQENEVLVTRPLNQGALVKRD